MQRLCDYQFSVKSMVRFRIPCFNATMCDYQYRFVLFRIKYSLVSMQRCAIISHPDQQDELAKKMFQCNDVRLSEVLKFLLHIGQMFQCNDVRLSESFDYCSRGVKGVSTQRCAIIRNHPLLLANVCPVSMQRCAIISCVWMQQEKLMQVSMQRCAIISNRLKYFTSVPLVSFNATMCDYQFHRCAVLTCYLECFNATMCDYQTVVFSHR